MPYVRGLKLYLRLVEETPKRKLCTPGTGLNAGLRIEYIRPKP